MPDCIFCDLSKQVVPSHKVYENDTIYAFLDKHPINPGHVLVVPKVHEPEFYKLNQGMYASLMNAVKLIASRVSDVMKPKKVGLIVAGWDIPHTHVHIVPMREYHDITSKSLLEGKRANPREDELIEIAMRLS
jgi:histidine triad (HIT) family protein